MFVKGQFGNKRVFMEDLLSQPLNLTDIQPTQTPGNPELSMPSYGGGGGGGGAIGGGTGGGLVGILGQLLGGGGGGSTTGDADVLPAGAFDSPSYASPYSGQYGKSGGSA